MRPNDNFGDIPEEIRKKLDEMGIDPENVEVISGFDELKEKLGDLDEDTKASIMKQVSGEVLKAMGKDYLANMAHVLGLTCSDVVPALQMLRMAQMRGQKWYEPQADSRRLMKKYRHAEADLTAQAADEYMKTHGYSPEDYATFTLNHMLNTFERAVEIVADIKAMYLKEIGRD